MFQRSIHILFLLALLIENVISEPVAVDPPIVSITNNGDKSNSDNYDVKIRKYTKVAYKPVVRMVTSQTEPTSSTTTTTEETNNLINVPTVTTFEENFLNGDIEADLSEESCAFTFTMPNPLPTSQQVCVKDLRDMMKPDQDDDGNEEIKNALLKLQTEVSEWQSSMENWKSDVDGKLAATDLEVLKSQVDILQKESRNMNFRISQLYMQLLHEIIRRKDDTLEYTSMENSVLNITVKYYELKDRHEALVIDHDQLERKSESQEEKIGRLQDKMEQVLHKLNRVVLNQEILMQARRDPAVTIRTTTARPPTNFRDCSQLQQYGYVTSGQYSLTLSNMNRKLKVWCDFDEDPGGWTVIQRRSNKKVNFYRNMASYQRGFGELDGDFWLGLENIHKLTNQPGIIYKLHIDMEDWNGGKTFVEYGSFKVGGQNEGYKLKIAHYSGDAGDSLTLHNGMNFTAKNFDNDQFSRNCAHYLKGGWWYNSCGHSNLNGVYYEGGHYRSKYQDGIFWKAWRGPSYSLKKVEMKISPNEW